MCIGYELKGKKIDYLPAAVEDQLQVKPIYKSFKGWKTSTKGIKSFKDLPKNAQEYIKGLEKFIETKVASISTSPERKDTILIENPFSFKLIFGSKFFDLLAFIIDFCNFSKALVSICLTLSLLILNLVLNSSNVFGFSLIF